ncbi:MAG: ABC transporter permease, partial [Treponema sp.]|nr:ABC transporter permease [Treponema sp.]
MAVVFQKTFFKTLLRDISQSLGRFVATFAIIALGVGFLAGLLATTPDMKVSADRYFDKTNMMDLFIKGTMGLTGEDRDALAALDEVASVQGAYVTDALVHIAGDQTLVARIYGLALENIGERDFINRMELLEGRMPLEDNECLVQQGGGFFADLAPGTTLTIEDTEDPGVYARTSYTVTGIVKSPLYLSTEREPSRIGNGRLGAVLYVREQAYALGVYTDFYLTLRGAAELSAFTEAYQKLVDSGISKIEALAKERSAIRHGEILAEARKTAAGRLDEAEAAYREGVRAAELELEGARKKLDDGKADLIQGEAELAGAEERIARGRAALEEEEARAARDLADNERALAAGEAEIARAKRTLAESKARLDLAKEEVERARASRIGRASSRARKGIAQYDEGLAAWEAGRAAVAEKEAELRQARDLLEAGKVRARGEFLRAREELDAGEEELRSGRARLASAREELLRGEAEYAAARADALAELRAGREGLDEARRNMADIDIAPPQWYVLDRNANVGCVNYKANAEKIADVAKVFPIFFLLVAALVALTTMTRMIEEKRTQIGVLKALGYQKRVIIAKYLVYCGLISILGSAAGMVSGFQGIPIIIYQAFGTMYHLPPLVTKFNWTFGLIACASTLGCITGVTLFASCGALWEKPAALMVPRAPRAGKRILLEYIPLIWRPLKFTYKVTARNLIRYKKHFFMTVTGIAGCTALMVTGFGLRDSLIDIARTQFEELLAYDLRIGLREDGGRDGVLEEFLNDAGNYAEMHSETVSLMDDDGVEIHATLYVPKVPEDLSGYIKLRDRKTRRPLPFSGSSVVLTEKMAAALKLRP